MANSIDAARLADRAYFYDNTPEAQSAQLIFRCIDGRPEKNYRPLPAWAEPIRAALLLR